MLFYTDDSQRILSRAVMDTQNTSSSEPPLHAGCSIYFPACCGFISPIGRRLCQAPRPGHVAPETEQKGPQKGPKKREKRKKKQALKQSELHFIVGRHIRGASCRRRSAFLRDPFAHGAAATKRIPFKVSGSGSTLSGPGSLLHAPIIRGIRRSERQRSRGGPGSN